MVDVKLSTHPNTTTAEFIKGTNVNIPETISQQLWFMINFQLAIFLTKTVGNKFGIAAPVIWMCALMFGDWMATKPRNYLLLLADTTHQTVTIVWSFCWSNYRHVWRYVAQRLNSGTWNKYTFRPRSVVDKINAICVYNNYSRSQSRIELRTPAMTVLRSTHWAMPIPYWWLVLYCLLWLCRHGREYIQGTLVQIILYCLSLPNSLW